MNVKKLRSEGRLLKPVIAVGKSGITEGLVAQLEHELDTKQLVKVQLRKTVAKTSEERKQMATTLCEKTSAQLVDLVGMMAVLYRK